MDKRKILTIIPAGSGWTATHSNAGEVVVRPIVCWALVDTGTKQTVVPMVSTGRDVEFCDTLEDEPWVGTSGPEGTRPG